MANLCRNDTDDEYLCDDPRTGSGKRRANPDRNGFLLLFLVLLSALLVVIFTYLIHLNGLIKDQEDRLSRHLLGPESGLLRESRPNGSPNGSEDTAIYEANKQEATNNLTSVFNNSLKRIAGANYEHGDHLIKNRTTRDVKKGQEAGRNQSADTTKRRSKTSAVALVERGSREKTMKAIHFTSSHPDRQYDSLSIMSPNNSRSGDSVVYRFWTPADWVDETKTKRVFYLDRISGHVTVKKSGVYMVYAQMVYHDLTGRWSFGIFLDDMVKVKCLATEQLRDLREYHPTSHGVYHQCSTSLVMHIRENQSLTIRCMYGSRTILTRPEFTFWGIVKLA